ncbi:hypothetical protein Tco_0924351 [Tanacetum coccineum]|uniref:Uncharacterized protein n=1 Tax=Tanacetum coccineum TaxID=301880 RepID=A0ABQ5D6B7_9ASTR
MKESVAYITYYAFAFGKEIPKPKYVRRSTREKTKQAPEASPGKRLQATAKVAKSGKKKLPAQGFETLSEIALTEAEQMNIITKRSKTQFHLSHASGSGADEGTGVSPGVPDVPTYGSEAEQISWKSSDEDVDDEVSKSKDDDDDDADNEDDDGQDDDDQDDENEQTESDNDGDDFVHPKYSTHDQEERQDEEDKEEEGSDLRVQTPSHYESTDDEESDEETQGTNVEGEELDEEDTNEKEEANELYRDMNVNLEGRDIEMTDAPQTNIQDVPVSTNVEMPPSSVTPLLPPPIPFIHPQQQTPVPTPIIVPSTSLRNLPTFGSLFKFEDRVKALEDNFSEFQQTNQFAAAVSSIPSIVDTYLANKMNEAVKTYVQLQSDRLRDEAQAENENFINTLDENMRKIIKKQVKEQVKEQVSKILPKIEKFVNDQLEAKVLTRSSNQAKTSHAKTLYKALVDAYETDKDILETYRDTVIRAGKELESTSAPKEKTSKSTEKSKEGSKSHHTSTGKSAQEEPIHADKDLEEPAHQEFDTVFTKDQSVNETTQHPD